MTRNNMNGKFSVVNQQLFQTYLSWPTQTLWWCYCHHKTCRRVTLLLMERPNIRKITSWYGKYIIIFHRPVIDVRWWFCGFSLHHQQYVSSAILGTHRLFLKANVFVLRRDVQWLAHGDLAQPSCYVFSWTQRLSGPADSQCWGLLSSKMWKASIE